MRGRRHRPGPEAPWTWPYRGTVVWLSAEEGGRRTGPPRPDAVRDWYAVTASVPTSGATASFLLRDFDPDRPASPARGRWLVPGAAGVPDVAPGSVLVVTEGPRTVAHFHVQAVDAG